MSDFFLEQLKNKLEESYWFIQEELTGNGYDITEVWVISRPNGYNSLHLEFKALNKSNVLPMLKSYGCRIEENKDIELYFGKISKSWDDDLNKFIEKLNQNY